MHTLSQPDAALIKKSGKAFKIIVSLSTLRSECGTDPILKELFTNTLDFALRYTESVCRWQRMVTNGEINFEDPGSRQAIEDVRTSVHNAFNDNVNILSRTMVRAGKSIEWRNKIGDDRSALGRFALTLSFEAIMEMEKGGAS